MKVPLAVLLTFGLLAVELHAREQDQAFMLGLAHDFNLKMKDLTTATATAPVSEVVAAIETTTAQVVPAAVSTMAKEAATEAALTTPATVAAAATSAPTTTVAVTTTSQSSETEAAVTAPAFDVNLCIRCICLSKSKCDDSVCDPRKELCDLWHINYVAWRASGEPTLTDREYPNPISAFEHCRSNATCAAQSMAQYFELNKAVRVAVCLVDYFGITLFKILGFVVKC